MDLQDRLPVDPPTTGTTLTRAVYVVALVATVLGLAHHVDHIVRGNHVGWPLTPEVTPFTYSLAIYRRSRSSASGLDPEGEGRKLR